MYSFTHAEAAASDDLWAWYSAIREIGAAIGALESATAALVSLVVDSDWQSDGVRSLHRLLRRLQEQTGTELGDLKVREAEVEAVGAA